mgnify:CR=1 FL=1
MKIVDSKEFDVAKRTVAATKLQDDDRIESRYRGTDIHQVQSGWYYK